MKERTKKILYFLFILSPGFAFAVTAPANFAGIVSIIVCLLLDLVPIIILLAFVEFLRGLIGYVSAGDNEEKRTQGIQFMIYGMIGFFVIVGIWGILKLFTGTFGFSFGIPQFATSSASISTTNCSSIL